MEYPYGESGFVMFLEALRARLGPSSSPRKYGRDSFDQEPARPTGLTVDLAWLATPATPPNMDLTWYRGCEITRICCELVREYRLGNVHSILVKSEGHDDIYHLFFYADDGAYDV